MAKSKRTYNKYFCTLFALVAVAACFLPIWKVNSLLGGVEMNLFDILVMSSGLVVGNSSGVVSDLVSALGIPTLGLLAAATLIFQLSVAAFTVSFFDRGRNACAIIALLGFVSAGAVFVCTQFDLGAQSLLLQAANPEVGFGLYICIGALLLCGLLAIFLPRPPAAGKHHALAKEPVEKQMQEAPVAANPQAAEDPVELDVGAPENMLLPELDGELHGPSMLPEELDAMQEVLSGELGRMHEVILPDDLGEEDMKPKGTSQDAETPPLPAFDFDMPPGFVGFESDIGDLSAQADAEAKAYAEEQGKIANEKAKKKVAEAEAAVIAAAKALAATRAQEAADSEKKQTSEQKNAEQPYCAYCHKPIIPPDALFCIACGNPVKKEEKKDGEEQQA